MRVRKAMYDTADREVELRRPFAAQSAALRIGGDADDDFEDMFDLVPVPLWLEDHSGPRELLEAWRAEGITDLRAHLRERPVRVAECAARIRVVRVNRCTLERYGADSVDHLVASLPRVFRDDLLTQHAEAMLALWEGRERFRALSVNYALTGQRLDVLLDGRVLPGHERTWRRVLVARM
jgi:hypothetical protein